MSLLPLYLDYNAMAPLTERVREQMVSLYSLLGNQACNPSSTHSFGRNARRMIESARNEIANALGVESKTIIFTSGATEANAMILAGFDGAVLTSSIEHSSILDARSDITFAPVDAHGVVLLDFIERWLLAQKSKALVSIMAVNNETGVIQPIKEIAALCQQKGAYFHSDIVQAVGRVPVDCTVFDCATISGHKLGALPGIGCLVMKETFPLRAMIRGGGQERSFRAGTENITGIISLATALTEAMSERRQKDWRNVCAHQRWMENEITTFCKDALIMGGDAPRLMNTTCITMPGLKVETQVMRFDLEGIAVSAGSACSSGKIKKSRVLLAMGIPDRVAETALRISLSPHTSRKEVELFVSVWKTIYESIDRKDKITSATDRVDAV